MNRLVLLFCLLAGPAAPAWIELRPPTGPLVVLSDAGDDPARLALSHIEQFRYALGLPLGQTELKSSWPVTIAVRKSAEPMLGFGRTGIVGAWKAGAVPPRSWWKQLGAVFLESSLPGRLPPGYEAGLLDLYSTLDVKGPRLTLGAPPPPPDRTAAWALLHLLLTQPDTSTKTRVFLSNLVQGADPDTASRNVFQLRFQELEAKAAAYREAARFVTTPVSGRALDVERFKLIPASPAQVKLLPGDLALARRAPPAEIRAAYQAALAPDGNAGAHEGLALAALLDNDPATARAELEAAVAGQGAGPRAWLEHGRLLKEPAQALKAFERALELNPSWAEIHVRIAEIANTPGQRALALKRAAEAEPRNKALWIAYAQASENAGNFADAAPAWRSAERAAATQRERDELGRLRLEANDKRAAAEAEARRRKSEAERAELERLRNEALERIKAAEAKAGAAAGPLRGRDPQKWWEGPPVEKLSGSLERVDCLGRQLRLSIRTKEPKPVLLAVPDPARVVLLGGGEKVLKCGAQKPPRSVNVEYIPKPDPKLGILGQAAVIEFP